MPPLGRVSSAIFAKVNRSRQWWQLPKPFAMLNLLAFRDDLRRLNLYEGAALPKYRTYDGSMQDPHNPTMGMVGTRFGRNAPPGTTLPEPMPRFMEPSPREVSRRLLLRDVFKPATSLNLLAACWIQFENHDWLGHGPNNPSEFFEVPLSDDDDWPERPMRVRRTSPDRTHMNGGPPTYINTVTH